MDKDSMALLKDILFDCWNKFGFDLISEDRTITGDELATMILEHDLVGMECSDNIKDEHYSHLQYELLYLDYNESKKLFSGLLGGEDQSYIY